MLSGYAGKTCQEETDPCTSSPCQNSGTCARNGTQFRCDCGPGFGGPLCQHNLNECMSSPCVHGICVDQQDGYRCFCQPGQSLAVKSCIHVSGFRNHILYVQCDVPLELYELKDLEGGGRSLCEGGVPPF
jgi:hypothetical protein